MNCLSSRIGFLMACFSSRAAMFATSLLAVIGAVILIAGNLVGHLNPVHIAMLSLGLVFGIPVVTYTFELQPGQTAQTGGTTPPTALQSSKITTIVATVFMDTSDTTVSIVHNWQLPQLDQQLLFPLVSVYATTLGAQGTAVTNPGIEIDLPAASTTPANSITLNKSGTGAGTGGTFNVILLRPHTIMGGV